MSIEKAILELAGAIRQHAEAIASVASGPTIAPKVEVQDDGPVKEKAETVKTETKPVKEKAEEAKPEVEETKAEEPAAETEETKAEQPTYQEVATAITTLSRSKGRDAALAVLNSFEAKNLKEVDPSQFADVLAAANKALEA